MAELAVETVRLPLATPLLSAWGSLAERELVRVRLSFGAGDAGDGEAAPLEPYDGVPLAAVLAALDAYAAVLAGAGPEDDAAALLEACRAERPLPQALAAIDLALWDRAGRQAGRPVAALLGGDAAEPVEVNALIGAEDRAGAARAAAEAVAAGHRCVKVKVGIGDDAGRLAAVRAAVGPGVAIRADANGAWGSPREALANLRALAPIALELCEEPVHGLEALREVRAESPVPIAIDESAAGAGTFGAAGRDAPGAAGAGAADAVCLKIARCGGIGGVLRDAAAARAAGSSVYVASTFDGPHGIAAALHAAAALRATGELLPCGLAAAAGDPPEVLRGRLAVPPGPGLLGDAILGR
ncbi:MAG TPA: enolase C-terminal domain-like protein [Solirubrobacteraceae bacterium]|nr:enolase C-terminal domain-like protein [Solirubrobacteraceae bacterium]